MESSIRLSNSLGMSQRFILLITALSACLLLIACNGGSTGNSPASIGGKTILGYYTGDSSSLTSATASSVPITSVSIDITVVGADGSLTSSATVNNLVASEQGAGRTSYICISNFGATDFDPAIAHGAMVTNRDATVANILALAQSVPGLAGINIDFEGLYPADRDAYTAFVTELAAKLHAAHYTLMLSVPAKTADDPGDTWSWPYDYAALAAYADVLQVMTYDENTPPGPPGPVAGIDWMQASLKYAISLIPADKVLLGLPAYGYDWNVTAGTGNSVNWNAMPALLSSTHAVPQWDSSTDSAYIDYAAGDGSMHEVWYETPEGIQAKAHLAVSLNLKGVSMWALGLEDARFWTAVVAGLK